MSLEVRIEGSAALRRVSDQIRVQGRKDIGREMAAALTRAIEPVRVSITAEAGKVMPSAGGYRSVLTRSLKFRSAKRAAGTQASYVLTTYAEGTKNRRDLKALERGILRHPVFGRGQTLRRGPRAGTRIKHQWSVTSIRPGFHKRGTDEAMEQAQEQMIEVVEDFAHRLIG